MEMAIVIPRSLNEPVGLAPFDLEPDLGARPLGEARGGYQRRPALQQGDHRRARSDGKEGAVLLHDAPPSGAHDYPCSSPMTRSTPPTRSTACNRRSSSMVASRSPSRAGWVRKIRRASSANPTCSMARIDDLVVAEHLGHGGQNPGPIGHVHAEVEGGPQLGLGSHRDARPLGRRRRRAGAQVASRIDQIAEHGTCGRPATGAPAVEHELAAHRSFDEHGVEGAAHGRQRVRGGHHRRVHPDRELGTAVDQFGHGQELDRVAEPIGVRHVDRPYPGDPLSVDIGVDHVTPERQGGQDGRLGGGVVSLDVGGGIALGQAEALGLGQRILEVDSVLFHTGQDEVRRAVDDAHDPHDLLAGQRLT